MLKGHVFSKQLFGNPIFALFINTFLNGENGISDNYKNGMAVTYSGSVLTVDSGAVCIQGRFLEEDTFSQVAAGTDVAYCKLVIEIDLDKQNTKSEFAQGAYKVVKSNSGYPSLTQTNIVKNNSGIYQYELARFRTTASGITDFQDKRTYLNFNTIYAEIRKEYGAVLDELEQALADVKDGSDYLLKSAGGTVEGLITANGGIKGNLTGNVTGNVSGSSGSCTGNAATATKATTCTGNSATASKLQKARTMTLSGVVNGSVSFDGTKDVTITTTQNLYTVVSGIMTLNKGSSQTSTSISYPTGFNVNNTIIAGLQIRYGTKTTWASGSLFDSAGLIQGSNPAKVALLSDRIDIAMKQIILNDNAVVIYESTETIKIYYKLTLLKTA